MGIWSTEDIDSLLGKVAIVTGGTSGIGLETVRVLAKHGARVIMAGHDQIKGQQLLEKLKKENPDFDVRYEKLDLSQKSSIMSFADRMMQEESSIDILINNAGIAGIPKRHESSDGHELIFATNYLGHFILTTQLFPMILRSSDPRVIFVSSLEHKDGKIHFNDLDLHYDYQAGKAYAQSKLAMLMFALELHRRCQNTGIRLRSIPVHPGATSTHIFDEGPMMTGSYFHPAPLIQRVLIKTLGQKADKGALPLIFAATSIEARSGIYYGPSGPYELWGSPREAKVALSAENLLARTKLWELSEKLGGVKFVVENSRSIGLH